MYMTGCHPFVSTAVASADPQSQWTLFYTAPLGLGVINLALVLVAFRDRLSWKISEQQPGGQTLARKSAWKEMQATLQTPSVWLLSLFFFFFLGAVITAGGENLVHPAGRTKS